MSLSSPPVDTQATRSESSSTASTAPLRRVYTLTLDRRAFEVLFDAVRRLRGARDYETGHIYERLERAVRKVAEL